jgi:hypothetical protein
MPELIDRVFTILSPIIAATLTALFTHYWARSRENHAKKMKIVGWLEWLKNYLAQIDYFPLKQQRVKTLPWWADHAMQNIGDSLHLLREDTRKSLVTLINECWVDAPVTEYISNGTGREAEIVDAKYDKDNVQKMKNDIENLIKRIKDP